MSKQHSNNSSPQITASTSHLMIPTTLGLSCIVLSGFFVVLGFKALGGQNMLAYIILTILFQGSQVYFFASSEWWKNRDWKQALKL